MTEQFLHKLWNSSVLPVHKMKLIDGTDFLILDKGIYNQFQSGPDFSNAVVKLQGIEWHGDIEFHLKSSDWMRHQHQFDRAYDNVVLHIVWFHDLPIIQNGRLIPTLELSQFVSLSMYTSYLDLLSNKSEILCKSYLTKIPSIYLRQMIDCCSTGRLQRKVAELDLNFEKEESQVLYCLLAKNFGSNVNAQPFEELSNRIPLSLLKKMNKNKAERLLLSTSGLFSDMEAKHENRPADEMPKFVWKFKGLRPSSFPNKRVVQFAKLIALIDWDKLMTLTYKEEIFDFTGRLFIQFNKENLTLKLSKSFQNLLLINSIVPFFIWKNRSIVADFTIENAVEFLSLLPAESNHITIEWKKLGIIVSNAFESQGLIELHKYYCKQRKCLNCSVGQKLMRE